MEDIIFFLHISSLGLAALGIVLADHTALAWLRGTRKVVDSRVLHVSHMVVTAGLVGLILSGLFLFWPERLYLLGQPFFLLKMVFVASLVINSFFIEHLMHTAVMRPFASLSVRQKIPFIVSGAISTLSWIGAGVVALVLFW